MLSIDNSYPLSILYPTFAFLLKLPRLQLAGDATVEGGGKQSATRGGRVGKRASRNFLPAIAHRLTGNTSHKRGGAMPRFRVFVIPVGPRENFGPRPINGMCSRWRCLRTSHNANDGGGIHVYVYILPYSTPYSTTTFRSRVSSLSNAFDLLLIVPRGLLFMSMDNSLKLQKRFRRARRRAVRRFSETIEFWI